jgi:hypothetical protein
VSRHGVKNLVEEARGQSGFRVVGSGFWKRSDPKPQTQNLKPAFEPLTLPPHPLPQSLSPAGRASSPSRPGQDARATGGSSGAQASSLCGTGWKPVLPGQESSENPGTRSAGVPACGSPWPSPHHPLSQISLTPGQAALVWGAPVRPLAAAAAAWGAARGARVLVVDAANAFDPYRLVREARSRGVSRAAAPSRVRVARAFTSHQLVRLLKEELAGELAPLSLVLILGPVSLFYDEQIPLAERRRLFGHMVDTLTAYKSRAPLLLLQPPLPRGAVNRHFGRLMTPLLDSLVKMENHQENRIGTPGGEVSMGASPSRFHDRGKRRYPGPGRSQTGGLSRGRIGI